MYACFNWRPISVLQHHGQEYSFAGMVRPGTYIVGVEAKSQHSKLELTEPQCRRLLAAMYAQMRAVDAAYVDAVVNLNCKEIP